MSLSYYHPIGKKIDVFAKLSYLGISGLWVDDGNTDKTTTSNLVTSVLGFDLKFDHFKLIFSGGINNILNEKYVEFTNTNSIESQFYNARAPINYFATLNLVYAF